jgi:UDP-N-acetylmuramoyl-tripeptide--D-alanyl-D-alanine ligase
MNHAGEIASLAKIAEPDWAVVSNVAPVHLEFFSEGITGIAKAKYELVESLPKDGVAVLNFDDPFVKEFGRGMGERAVMYGMGEGAQVRAVHIAEMGVEGLVFTVEVSGERASVQLRMLGRHNVPNALAAIAVGLRMGMTLAECAAAVSEMRAGDKRGEVLEWREAVVINDCYNSNPRALDAMVDALLAIPAERHVVIAGEMLELGPDTLMLHAACGARMAQLGAMVVGVRGAAEALVAAAKEAGGDAVFVADAVAAGEWLLTHVQAGDAVLLKASRGVRLEKALEAIAEKKA